MKAAIFSVNEVIMAADKGKMYEAKVLKAMENGSGWHYFIHYNGWARRYDTWIDEVFISRPDDQNRMDLIRESTKTSAGGKDSAKGGKAKKAKTSHPNESAVMEIIPNESR